MMNDTVRPSRRRQHWMTLLSVPVITFSLCSFVIDPAAHAAEASKDAPPAANLPRILVLATGGTIAGQAETRAPVRTNPARSPENNWSTPYRAWIGWRN
jgi:L-asparaginase